jgi:hypothetical protein
MTMFATILLGVFLLGVFISLVLNIHGRITSNLKSIEASVDVAGRSMVILFLAMIVYVIGQIK